MRFCANIMGHNQTAHLLSFGNSLIRVHRINAHPCMSTALSPVHKVTNQIDKISMVLPFWAVKLQFHLCAMCIYVILCKHYGSQSDCSLIVIWEQPNQGS